PVLAASLATFAVTNIDDIFLLTLFFARRIPARRIVAGQYLGFSAIILVSLAGALAALSVPHGWVRWLGLLPLWLVLWQLYRTTRGAAEGVQGGSHGVVTIALITLTNGADNVGVYVPYFLLNRSDLLLILVSYGVFVGAWCFVGWWIGNHPA